MSNPIQVTRTTLTPTTAPALRPQVDAIRAATKTPHEQFTDTAIARMALTVILEPGDEEAGALIRTHGHGVLLNMLVNADGHVPERLVQAAQLNYTATRVARRLDQTVTGGFAFLTQEHPSWPLRLNDLGDSAPVALWCAGNPAALTADQVTAIIGSRDATSYGEHVAMNIAADLAAVGRTIINGAAFGIDGRSARLLPRAVLRSWFSPGASTVTTRQHTTT